MDRLKDIRKKIDECDEQIIKAFEERMEAVAEILSYKRQQGMEIYDINRETEVVERAIKNLESPQYKDEATELIKTIIRISRRIQSKVIVPFNLVLIGFMGTGKTTVGKVLAKELDMDFVDLDNLIEERIGMPISRYFQEQGEASFRQVEREIVREVSNGTNRVVSCGGGVVLDDNNIIDLRKNGRLILLTAGEETIYSRVKEEGTRPLLKNQRGIERIRELLQQRQELYRNAADLVISTEDKTPEDIGRIIIKEAINL